MFYVHRCVFFHGSDRDFTDSALLKAVSCLADTLPFFPTATNVISIKELLSTQEILGLSFDYLFCAFFFLNKYCNPKNTKRSTHCLLIAFANLYTLNLETLKNLKFSFLKLLRKAFLQSFYFFS